jgi:sugar phosphate isomerase/epimerase
MKIFLPLILATTALFFNAHGASPIADSCKIGGFALGCQAYSFNKFTAFEAIEKAEATGGKTIELFLWQKMGGPFADAEVNALLNDKQIAALKAKLDASHLRATSAYFGNSAFTQKDPEAALRKVFEFARKMDMVALTGEPPESGFDLVEKLCKEYDLKFCLHNHKRDEAKPEYKNWDPSYTIKLMEKRDPRMGFCLDTGHLVRSGLKPVDAIKLFGKRLHSLHLKDPVSATDHDTIYGTGVADVKGILRQLKKQKFNGFISIEYENNWMDSVPDIRQCIEFVRANGKK